MKREIIGYILIFWFPTLWIIMSLFNKEGRKQLLEIGFLLVILISMVKGCCLVGG